MDEELENELYRVKITVYALVVSFPEPSTPFRIRKEYEEEEGAPLNYQKFGFSRLEGLLDSHEKLYSVMVPEKGLAYKAVPSQASQDIFNLVAKQKKKKKGKGKRGRGGSNFQRSYSMRGTPSRPTPFSRNTMARSTITGTRPSVFAAPRGGMSRGSSIFGGRGSSSGYPSAASRLLPPDDRHLVPGVVDDNSIDVGVNRLLTVLKGLGGCANIRKFGLKYLELYGTLFSGDELNRFFGSKKIKSITRYAGDQIILSDLGLNNFLLETKEFREKSLADDQLQASRRQPPRPREERHCKIPSLKELYQTFVKLLTDMYPTPLPLDHISKYYERNHDIYVDPMVCYSKTWDELVTGMFKERVELRGENVHLTDAYVRYKGIRAPDERPVTPRAVPELPVFDNDDDEDDDEYGSESTGTETETESVISCSGVSDRGLESATEDEEGREAEPRQRRISVNYELPPPRGRLDSHDGERGGGDRTPPEPTARPAEMLCPSAERRQQANLFRNSVGALFPRPPRTTPIGTTPRTPVAVSEKVSSCLPPAATTPAADHVPVSITPTRSVTIAPSQTPVRRPSVTEDTDVTPKTTTTAASSSSNTVASSVAGAIRSVSRFFNPRRRAREPAVGSVVEEEKQVSHRPPNPVPVHHLPASLPDPVTEHKENNVLQMEEPVTAPPTPIRNGHLVFQPRRQNVVVGQTVVVKQHEEKRSEVEELGKEFNNVVTVESPVSPLTEQMSTLAVASNDKENQSIPSSSSSSALPTPLPPSQQFSRNGNGSQRIRERARQRYDEEMKKRQELRESRVDGAPTIRSLYSVVFPIIVPKTQGADQ